MDGKKSAAANEKGEHCGQNSGYFPHILPLHRKHIPSHVPLQQKKINIVQRGTDLSLFRIRDEIYSKEKGFLFPRQADHFYLLELKEIENRSNWKC